MPTTYNYTHAARRLVKDAVALWSQGASETASHLAGLAAECVLKSIMVGLGVLPLGANGQTNNKKFFVHICAEPQRTQLWSEFHANLTGRSGSAFAALVPPQTPHPFDGWLVDHRYVADHQLQMADMAGWVWAAIILRNVHEQAATDGIVT
jgi:hypothetical protein